MRRKHAAWAAICIGCIAGAEGLRTVVYLDPVGIPTYCFGETRGARLGDRYTPAQCTAKLGTRVLEFGRGVDGCIDHPLPAPRKAAYTSAAYNIGVDAFCKSSMARKENAGDVSGACDALLLYVYASGVKLPGLVKRREQERELCLSS